MAAGGNDISIANAYSWASMASALIILISPFHTAEPPGGIVPKDCTQLQPRPGAMNILIPNLNQPESDRVLRDSASAAIGRHLLFMNKCSRSMAPVSDIAPLAARSGALLSSQCQRPCLSTFFGWRKNANIIVLVGAKSRDYLPIAALLETRRSDVSLKGMDAGDQDRLLAADERSDLQTMHQPLDSTRMVGAAEGGDHPGKETFI